MAWNSRESKKKKKRREKPEEGQEEERTFDELGGIAQVLELTEAGVHDHAGRALELHCSLSDVLQQIGDDLHARLRRREELLEVLRAAPPKLKKTRRRAHKPSPITPAPTSEKTHKGREVCEK